MDNKEVHNHTHSHTYEHNHEHNHSHGEHSHCHGEHEHTHGHCCTHSHTHDDSSLSGELNKDDKVLKLLLKHWIEHNKTHEEGFKEWAEKAKSLGREETSSFISKAVEFMEKADEMLTEAEKSM